MTDVVVMADPRVTEIGVLECGDPLCQLDESGFMTLDDREAGRTGNWRWLRAGVVQRLVIASGLLPAGLRLLHIEGHRAPAVQAEYFAAYRADLARRWPELSAPELRQLASRYISPPEIGPHCAGAAVDLTLCTTAGVELDLGTPVNANPEDSEGACYTAAENIDADAVQNRAILVTALSAAGLVNYPTEWWHWSYGDRYWAMATAQPSAIYGPVDLPVT